MAVPKIEKGMSAKVALNRRSRALGEANTRLGNGRSWYIESVQKPAARGR